MNNPTTNSAPTANPNPVQGDNQGAPQPTQFRRPEGGRPGFPSRRPLRPGEIRRRPGGAPGQGGAGRPGERPGSGDRRRPGGGRNERRGPRENEDNYETQVIAVRRVSKTVKGGKKMKFSALVVSGDKAGKVGYGLRKGNDLQDAVGKATRQAKENMIKIEISEAGSIAFPSLSKFKACRIYLKPAQVGTGLIAGGFLRPVLQLAGIQNVYSKVVGSNNKIVGVEAAIKFLHQHYGVKS